MKYGARLAAFALVVALLAVSCMGMDTKVSISSDGSGTVTAEYRLSEELVSFGEIESNKDLIPVPLSRADLERSLAGAKGLKLSSWSSGKDGTDTIIKTKISFDSLDSLMYYLDPDGQLAKHGTDSGRNFMKFTVGDRLPPIDPQMRQLAVEAFTGYAFRFEIEPPAKPLSADSGSASIAATIEGKTAVFKGAMKDIVASSEAPSLSISW